MCVNRCCLSVAFILSAVPFYMILDLAIGGLYPGFDIGDAAIDAGDAKFLVDSVKVYDILP